jgi:hypothetical protein
VIIHGGNTAAIPTGSRAFVPIPREGHAAAATRLARPLSRPCTLAPQVVEDQVTYPLSTALLTVPKSRVVRGFSFFGVSFVYIIFEDGTDLYWARSRVLEYLNSAARRLPRVDRDNPTLLAQFDCQRTALCVIMSCGGRQIVYCAGFHHSLHGCWRVETETVAPPPVAPT